MNTALIDLVYLVAAALFIAGLKRLSSPATARSGNIVAAVGMLLAIAATLFHREILGFGTIIAGVVVGSAIGLFAARSVPMTDMPQMVAVFNGFGGGASALVAAAELLRPATDGAGTAFHAATIALSVAIGCVTFSGSMIAFGKLQGLVTGRPVTYAGQHIVNSLVALAGLAAAVGIVLWGGGIVTTSGIGGLSVGATATAALVAMAVVTLVFGVAMVMPIGGADMPVVISLLNSFSGLAAAAAGFVIRNNALIISGALVGASGLILTKIMCKAMNRSLANVLFGAFGVGEAAPGAAAAGADGKVARSVTADEAAILLAYARQVVFVPGYGLAVAQAQQQVRELATMLEGRGVEVKYGIHPVAGRMPGHMNVLLAEANVPYTELYDMDQVNPELPNTDVAVVVGANDVVNPAARDKPDSPIYGMPIIEVDKAKNVIIIKRSLNPGFAGIDNDLFYMPNSMMLFADAKKALQDLIAAVKDV